MVKKIGIDGSILTKTQQTGVEVASYELITTLLGLDHDNHYIIYTQAPLPEEFMSKGNVTNRVVPPQPLWTQRALPAVVNHDLPDIFWSPAYMLPPKLDGRIKKIASIHDVAFMLFPSAYRFRDWLLSFVTVLRAKFFAKVIVTVSLQTKADLKRLFLIPASRITVIPNALPSAHKQPLMHDIREKYQLPEDFILGVGRIEPRKNSARILRSFVTIAENHPSLHLVFAGPPSRLAGEMKAKATELGLGGRVHFIGFVDMKDLPILYRQALVFLFPSKYEGFGIPILESFTAGTPVITTNFGATAEVAGRAALLVNPNDTVAISRSVSHLIHDDDLRQKYVQAGHARVQEFSWEKSAAKLKGIIDGL